MHEAALAIGMILQRFRLIDVNRYQMHLKETLTIKPEGFKIKVRPRNDKERGAYAGAATPAAAASGAGGAARTYKTRATTRRCWCSIGSNLGTAEELAHPRRRSRRGQRFCRPNSEAARRLRRQAAGAGWRADLLRLL